MRQWQWVWVWSRCMSWLGASMTHSGSNWQWATRRTPCSSPTAHYTPFCLVPKPHGCDSCRNTDCACACCMLSQPPILWGCTGRFGAEVWSVVRTCGFHRMRNHRWLSVLTRRSREWRHLRCICLCDLWRVGTTRCTAVVSMLCIEGIWPV